MKYSSELAQDYSGKREKYNETDSVLISRLNKIGVVDKDVLDIGCGDGRHAILIKSMGANTVTGVDLNEKMIELARGRAVVNQGVVFLVADGKKLPIESRSKDLVVSNFVAHYFINSQDFFGEASRVLRDDGYFVGTFNIVDVKPGLEHLYNKQMPIRLGSQDSLIIVQNLIKSSGEVFKAIESSGFAIKEVKELDHPNAVVDDSFPCKNDIIKKAVIVVLQKVG